MIYWCRRRPDFSQISVILVASYGADLPLDVSTAMHQGKMLWVFFDLVSQVATIAWYVILCYRYVIRDCHHVYGSYVST